MTAQQAVVVKINKLCKENKVTVNHLAYISGMPPSTIKNIIYGSSTNTGVVTIAKICNGLGISLTDFFEDELFAGLDPEIY